MSVIRDLHQPLPDSLDVFLPGLGSGFPMYSFISYYNIVIYRYADMFTNKQTDMQGGAGMEKKFVPLEKMTKKARKKYYAQQRSSWNGVRPVTRVVASGTSYSRSREKRRLLDGAQNER